MDKSPNRLQKIKKQESSQRILKAAGHYFRSRGLIGTSVADVMQAAGMTVGGFYAHFRSKEELIKKAFQQMTKEVNAFAAGLSSWTAFVEIYLSSKHRDHFAKSCPIVALVNDVSRESQEVRNAFATELKTLIDERAKLFSIADSGKAQVITATYVGALALARATKGHEISDEILKNARQFLIEQAGKK
jgi:TetR/AcrR family transcriptional regulator, transcriptional repressor for nem operon